MREKGSDFLNLRLEIGRSICPEEERTLGCTFAIIAQTLSRLRARYLRLSFTDRDELKE